ncbi:MAG TPA: VOC family protein [Actinomycetota bacterium]|nr:VOC family protein [Actinomycetota bacterium]
MIDHIGLGVPSLAAAKSYYDEVMPLLGYEPFFANERQFSYQRTKGKPGTRVFFYTADEEGGYSHRRTGLQHLAFKVRSRTEVDDAHRRAVELGSKTVRPPDVYAQYHPNYYAAFWHDPHGFLLEAVCHRAEEG